MTNNREVLRIMTFSAYDLQMLRMQMGLRLTANFRNKLKRNATPSVDLEDAPEMEEDKDELSSEALKLIDQLKDSYRRLTDGVARNRKLPAQKGFEGDSLITEYTELVLVDQYLQIERDEKSQFRQLESALEPITVYQQWLKEQVGIGPAMAAVLVSYFDPYKAPRISNFWAYCGIDVGPDGRGRSRRAEHLIDRTYKKADGSDGVRKSVTYNPWLKSRLLGALATSFIRTKNCPWREYYDNRRMRIMHSNEPHRIKVTSVQYKKAYKQIVAEGGSFHVTSKIVDWGTTPGTYVTQPCDEVVTDITNLWPPLRVHRDAMRYMVKHFLIWFWVAWRKAEGLTVTLTYAEEKLGRRHSGPTPFDGLGLRPDERPSAP